MRCKYCHNPDTWEINAGTEVTVEELLERYERNKEFYRKGGITATGGVPGLAADRISDGAFYRSEEAWNPYLSGYIWHYVQ